MKCNVQRTVSGHYTCLTCGIVTVENGTGCEFRETDCGFQEDPRRIYIIGSLRNPCIPQVAKAIRDAMPDVEVFDDWYAAGPEADDYWKKYEQERGRSYDEALEGYAARNVYAFDKRHIDASTDVVLVLPAGKSGHLEFGYSIGQGKKGHILLEPDTDRWDVMYQFATSVQHDLDGLIKALKG